MLGDEIFKILNGDDWRRRQQRDVEKVLADEKTEVWVAETGGQVVGFVAAFLRVDEDMGEVYMLAVDPDSQNLGLAKCEDAPVEDSGEHELNSVPDRWRLFLGTS